MKEKSILSISFKYEKKKSIGFILLSILQGVIGFSLIPLKEYIIDEALHRNKIMFTILFFVLFILLEELLNILLNYLAKKNENSIRLKAEKELLEKIKEEDCSRIENKNFQNDIDIFKSIAKEQQQLLISFSQRVRNVVFILGIVVIIGMENLFFLFLYLLLAFVYIILGKKQSDFSFGFWEKYMENMKKANYFSHLMINREAAHERKIFNTTPFLNKRFEEEFEKAKFNNKKTGKIRLRLDILVELSGKLLLLFSFVTLSYYLLLNRISIGRFYVLMDSLIRIQSIISQEINKQNEFDCIKKIQNRFNTYLHSNRRRNPTIDEEKFGELLKEVAGAGEIRIVCKNLSFKYDNTEKIAVKNFSYEFVASKTYLIVGRNGEGKSTLFKLLTGIYEPTAGEILINGINLKLLSPKQKSKLFSVLFQTPNKYPLSIAENIMLGDTGSSFNLNKWKREFYDSSIIKYIDSLPNGWETNVGITEDKTINLSGGQWYKIFIGRTMLGKTPILFLDEPTSSMDPLAELQLFEKLIKYFSHRMNILISHRLGAARYADKILVLKEGRLIEEGDHETLLSLKGEYYELYETQKKLYQIS